MKNLNFRKNLWSYIGIIVGFFTIILGIKVFVDFHVYYPTFGAVKFGADFYTEIHSTVTRITNSIREIHEMLVLAIGWFFIFMGIVDICYFGRKLEFDKNTETLNHKMEQQG